MPIDLSCSHCGREPSHPQIRHRFVYAAYHRVEIATLNGQRAYVAALCEPCYQADRQSKIQTARNRFLSRVRRWSGLPTNATAVVHLLEHPEGVTGEEWESDSCVRGGVAFTQSAAVAQSSASQPRKT